MSDAPPTLDHMSDTTAASTLPATGASGDGAATERARRAPALSPSRANDYVQCPLLFRFRTIDRLPEPPSVAAARGTLVHAALERLYDAPAIERTPERALAALPGEWERMLESTPGYGDMFPEADAQEAWMRSARALVERYFTLEDPTRLEPEARELFVETELPGGPRLRGVVDRIDVAPNGAVRVVDYKTGKAPRPAYGESAAFQMRFYGLVVWREREVVPAMLQLIYLGDGQILRNEPTQAALEQTEDRIRALWASIVADAEAESFAPRTSRLCDWCNHQAICPAFGGVAPPIPEGAIKLNLGIA